jgi:hypothetical protein
VVINGIDDLLSRPDLQDRAISLTLEKINDDKRRTEAELEADFEKVRPQVLGALLDAVSVALRDVAGIRLEKLPRMADFAVWAAAAAPAFGWTAEQFLAAYDRNRGEATATALEASAIGPWVLRLLEKTSPWEGIARDLLRELEKYADEKTRKSQDWPKTARKLSGDLRRIAPALRAAGVKVDIGQRQPGGKRDRRIRLEQTCKTPSLPSRPSRTPSQEDATGGQEATCDSQSQGEAGGDTVPDTVPTVPDTVPTIPDTVPISPHGAPDAKDGGVTASDPDDDRGRDGRDGRDGMLREYSSNPDEETDEWTA